MLKPRPWRCALVPPGLPSSCANDPDFARNKVFCGNAALRFEAVKFADLMWPCCIPKKIYRKVYRDCQAGEDKRVPEYDERELRACEKRSLSDRSDYSLRYLVRERRRSCTNRRRQRKWRRANYLGAR